MSEVFSNPGAVHVCFFHLLWGIKKARYPGQNGRTKVLICYGARPRIGVNAPCVKKRSSSIKFGRTLQSIIRYFRMTPGVLTAFMFSAKLSNGLTLTIDPDLDVNHLVS